MGKQLKFVQEIEHKIRQAKSEKDLQECREMIGRVVYGRSYLMGQIDIMTDLIATFNTIEDCYKDNPNMVITQCFKLALDKFREKKQFEPYQPES